MDTGGKKIKRAVIVTKSTNFEPRAEVVGEYLKEKGVEVTYIYSDFSHREKKRLDRSEPDHIYIETLPYRRNLSWQRMQSQIDFAKKTENKLKELEFDLLYVLIPGNSLVPMGVNAVENKADKPKLVFDIIDLWPESLRLGKLEGIWPFTYWKCLRDRDINKADLIITECDLYREKLKLDPQKSVTMYWGKKESLTDNLGLIPDKNDPETEKNDSTGKQGKDLQIAYLGAINNIIDIDGIVRLLQKLNCKLKTEGRNVLLHVIGDGENRITFLQALESAGIRYIYHGAVFDEAEKGSILNHCSYGLNMMKPGVCVGMTMKSIDYWSRGLPVINNIPGDTRRLCREESLGINVDMRREDENSYHEIKDPDKKDAVDEILAGRLTDETCREHIRDIYKERFTEQAMYRILDQFLMQ